MSTTWPAASARAVVLQPVPHWVPSAARSAWRRVPRSAASPAAWSARAPATSGYTYDDYSPAYALGYNNARRFPSYDLAEPHMADEWDRVKGHSRLSWEQAKSASRAAWDRVERAIPGDSDRDGR